LDADGQVFATLPTWKLDQIHPLIDSSLLRSHRGSGSGGYLESVFRYAAQQLFEQPLLQSPQELNYQVLRNQDFIEVKLNSKASSEDGTNTDAAGDSQKPSQKGPLLSFAIVNGFRNIQTLVQRFKRKTLKYHYVEIMACPSGCLNGGAQLKGDSQLDNPMLNRVTELYKSLPETDIPFDPESDPLKQIYDSWFPNEAFRRKCLYTQFSPISKTQNPLAVQW